MSLAGFLLLLWAVTAPRFVASASRGSRLGMENTDPRRVGSGPEVNKRKADARAERMVGAVSGALAVIAVGTTTNEGRRRVVVACRACGRQRQRPVAQALRFACKCDKYNAQRKHGHAKSGDAPPTREYRSWSSMVARCENPAAPNYPRYGGRGISVCERWRNDFAAFLSDMGPRPPGTSLDRVDGDGNYQPGNCRWADARTQAQNRAAARKVEIGGELLCIAEWARRAGVSGTCIASRLRRGITGAALLLPGAGKRGAA